MAEHLARIYGTEEDRVNCPFYWKIGSCRHGDQCSRIHNRPIISQTVLLKNMYQSPPVAIAMAEGQPVEEAQAEEAQDHFEVFYEEVFQELSKFGEVVDMGVVDNIGDHLLGSVYVKFGKDTGAEKALRTLTGRFYAGRVIQPEFCPVTELSDARCRQYDDAQCSRGGFCNFLHFKYIPRAVKKRLFRRMYREHPEYAHDVAKESRRRTGDEKPRDGDRSERHERRHRHRDEDGHKKDRHDRSRSRDRKDKKRDRQTSEERRNTVAQWNKEVDESQL